jgi:hypothetical protein
MAAWEDREGLVGEKGPIGARAGSRGGGGPTVVVGRGRQLPRRGADADAEYRRERSRHQKRVSECCLCHGRG